MEPPIESAGEAKIEIELGERPELAASFALRLAAAAERALAERGRFTLALSGGSVAERFVPAFGGAASAGTPLDWSRIDLFWVDERAVPPDHADSNFGLAWRSGLAALPLEPAHVHRFRGEEPDLEREARAFERTLRDALGSPPRLDLALVGVGPDGHVASLFPGHPALAETERWVVAIDEAPKPPPRRLTVTLPFFAVVDLVVVAAFGTEKAQAVREAVEEPASPLPIARAVRRAARARFLLDPAAASELSRQ